ncbi:MAG: DUF1566 domain-containing protein [Tannerella sp.]|jgi:hypothetical protein|nr:DUF1566 domain-containing protein [Tannerella sp.]
MKTNLSRLPQFIIIAAIIFLSMTNTSLYSQVTIGDEVLPRMGALLDLKKNDGSTSAYIGSLLLPNVAITSMDSIPFGFTDAGALTSANKRDKNLDLAGSIVYNTLADTGEGIYLWDGDTWTRINLGGSVVVKSDPGNAADCDPFKADGTCESGYDVDDPACKQAGEFVFTWIAGESFIERLTVVDAGAGKFSVKFQPNDRASERQAILLVTSPCGNSNTFVFNQLGDPVGCGAQDVPAILNYNGSTAMCTGGAVYLYIPSSFTGDASNLIWTLNGQEVERGLTCVATVPGRYIIYNGKIGCEKKSEIQVTLNSGATAPEPVEFIVVGNNGIACGPGGTVELIVTRPVSGAIVWYKNGERMSAGSGYTVVGDASHIHVSAGSWQAVVEDGTCASLPVTANVTENASGGGNIYNPQMKINGVTGGYKLCQNGSMYLEVNNINSDYSYTWYIDNTQVGTGASGIYAAVPAAGKIVLRLRAVPVSSGCAQEALVVETVTATAPPDIPNITVGNPGNVLCGGQAALIAGTNNATSYRWFLNDSEISGNTASTLTAASVGTYTVTAVSSEGCVSRKSAGKEIIASDYASVSWTNPPAATASEGETKTYSVSVDFPVGAVYTWSLPDGSDKAQITNGHGTSSITVRFNTAGSVTVRCTVSTSCGNALGSPIDQVVTVGTSCTPAFIASTSSLTVSMKAGQTPPTLSVNASGSPLTYQWFSGTSGTENSTGGTTNGSTYTLPSGDIASPATKNYWCRVTATGCNSVNSETFTVKVTEDPVNLSTGTQGTLTGNICFDIAYSNFGGACGTEATRSSRKTDFSTSSRAQVYTFTASSAVSHVRFDYTEVNCKGLAIDSIVPKLASYEGGNGIITAQVTVYYKTSLNTELRGHNRDQALKLKLYVVYNPNSTYSSGSADQKQELNISLQDCVCCDGLLLEGGAFDYADGNRGDWAVGKTSGITNSMNTPNPSNLYSGKWYVNYEAFTSYFKETSVGALCWYKKNGNGGRNWSTAIMKCADGTYTDGDANAGWYLPNLRELDFLYRSLPDGSLGSKKIGTADTFGGSAAGGEALISNDYWSSMGYSSGRAYVLDFSSGYRNTISMGNSYYVRCVRRF